MARPPYTGRSRRAGQQDCPHNLALLVKGGTYPGTHDHDERIEQKEFRLLAPGSSGKVPKHDEPEGRYLDADQTV